MEKTYSEKLNDDLNNVYNEIDYDYDAVMDKAVDRELDGLYSELDVEMEAEINNDLNNVFDDLDGSATNAAAAKIYGSQPPKKPKKPKKPKEERSSKKIVLSTILIIAIGVFIIAGLKLLSIKKAYDDSKKSYQKVSSDFFKGDTDNIDDLDWDFTELFAQNPDVIAYIYCPDLLSYPIVQGSDNSYYLTHLFTGEWSNNGSIFADCNLPDKVESRNFIVYGHNMVDGSMFSKLMKYVGPDGEQFYQKHKEFHIFTPDDHHYVYKVVSAYTADVRSMVYTTNPTDEIFQNVLNEVVANKPYPTEHGELNVNSKIMTLSTCLDNYQDDLRHIVVLVRDREVPKKTTTTDANKKDSVSSIDE